METENWSFMIFHKKLKFIKFYCAIYLLTFKTFIYVASFYIDWTHKSSHVNLSFLKTKFSQRIFIIELIWLMTFVSFNESSKSVFMFV